MSRSRKPLTKEELKRNLVVRFGGKYLDFMQDLSNIKYTAAQLSEKWDVTPGALAYWVKILGYSRDFYVKNRLRNHYRIAASVKARQEKTRQLMSFINRLNKAP